MPPEFVMPAEWGPHEATWLAWPHEREDWPGKFEAIPWVYSEIVRRLCRFERVNILVSEEREKDAAKDVLERAGADGTKIIFHQVVTDRVWTRDYCTLFVRAGSGKLIATDWQFNGWAKYPNHKKDDAVSSTLARRCGWETVQPTADGRRIVLEGGSIDVDGQGLLLTTEECLLSPVQARNPGLSRETLEAAFAQFLGARKVLWLYRGIVGDDTHGHVDDLARFIAPNTVVTVVEDDRADANHEPLQENLERLRGMTGLDGKPLEIHTLPMPGPVLFDQQRLPASYANFYIANRCVLVPTFNDPRDRQALMTLAAMFPEREVIGIHAVDLVWGLGTLHCMTMQQPKVFS